MRHRIIGIGAASLLLGSTALAQDDITLELTEVITSPARTETLQALVDEFEAANPGVTVEITSLPWGQAFEIFATAVSAGNTPDVVEMPDRWMALYAANGALENLEPYIEDWDAASELTPRALEMARFVDETAYMIPYGFYLRAMFYNKNLLEEAGVANPPSTLEEFRTAAEAVSELPGKYGYCLRGGPGGYNGWMMFGATNAGTDEFFNEEGQSTLDNEGWVGGFEYLASLYQDGLAPPDSINWGFNEIVAGFYSGTCALLDQDPDALIAIEERMDPEAFGVVPFPKGPDGRAYPTIGYTGWSMFADSEHKDAAWRLIEHLSSRESNLTWNKRIGALPIYEGLEDDPFYGQPKFQGWFDTLSDPDMVPLVMPTNLEGFAFFADSLLPRTSQQLLLGQRTAQDVADEWATYLTEAYEEDAAR